MQRLRTNFQSGTIQSLTGTTLTFSSAPGFPIVTSGVNYIPLTINPTPYNGTSTPEIVWITVWAGGTTATVVRARESSTNTGDQGNGVVWSHGPTVVDFTLTSGMSEGTFPVSSVSGYIFVSASGANNPTWNAFLPAAQVSGGALDISTTISGSQVYGAIDNITISGAKITGNISATQISGGQFQSTALISGQQVTGYVSTANISGTLTNKVVIPTAQVSGYIPTSQVSGTFNTQVVMPAAQVSGTLVNAYVAGDHVTGVISGVQVSGYAPLIYISGSQVVGNQSTPLTGTVSGNQVYGPLTNDTSISGSQLRGNIPAAQVSGTLTYSLLNGTSILGNVNATQVSGGQIQQSVTISGQQINGSINSATISGNFSTNIGIQGSSVLGPLNSSTVSIDGSKIVNNILATQISGGALQPSVTISGAQVYDNIKATQISGGALQNTVTISGSQVKGFISATQISGGALQPSTTISGAQVYDNIKATQISGGALQNSVTISGSNVYGGLTNATIDYSRVSQSSNLATNEFLSGNALGGWDINIVPTTDFDSGTATLSTSTPVTLVNSLQNYGNLNLTLMATVTVVSASVDRRVTIQIVEDYVTPTVIYTFTSFMPSGSAGTITAVVTVPNTDAPGPSAYYSLRCYHSAGSGGNTSATGYLTIMGNN